MIEHLYYFDKDHRVYTDETGKKHSGPIYKFYWQKVYIVDEDDKYYYFKAWNEPGFVTHRLNKKKMSYKGVNYFTEEYMLNNIWLNDNKFKLIRILERCNDIGIFKDIEGILGKKGFLNV